MRAYTSLRDVRLVAVAGSWPMALYHFSAKVISRSVGRSAIAAAAYRAADRAAGRAHRPVHDYTTKQGVVHSEILLPEGAPGAGSGPSVLWNEVEAGRAPQGCAAGARHRDRPAARAVAGRGDRPGAGLRVASSSSPAA